MAGTAVIPNPRKNKNDGARAGPDEKESNKIVGGIGKMSYEFHSYNTIGKAKGCHYDRVVEGLELSAP